MGLFPVRCKHRVDDQVDVMIIKPFGIAQDGFFFEPKSFRYHPAFSVTGSAADLDPVESESTETVVDHRAASFGHNPFSLQLLGKPVTDHAGTIGPVKAVVTDHSAQIFLKPYRQSESFVLLNLFADGPNELKRVSWGSLSI